MKDFFLSHAGEDKEDFVRPLALALHRHGLTFWLDEAEIEWGDNLHERINEGLRDSRFVIAFLSQNFIKKRWPKKELYAALDIEDESGEKKVLPLMLCEPSAVFEAYPLLSQKVFVRFDEGPNAIAMRCKNLARKNTRIINNRDFDLEDQEEMLRVGYTKKENIEYTYRGTVQDHQLRLKTDIPAGTRVLVEVANVSLEDLATEFGARAAVIDALGKVMPDEAEKIEGNKEAMEALVNFAKLFAKPSLRKHRRRIPTDILDGGYLAITGLDDVLDGWETELKVTLI